MDSMTACRAGSMGSSSAPQQAIAGVEAGNLPQEAETGQPIYQHRSPMFVNNCTCWLLRDDMDDNGFYS